MLPISSRTSTPGEAEEIQAVLSSDTFSEAPLLSRLLKYLCSNYFNENKSTLNEYRIGVEALGRSADFDPAKNSSVRVEMHRLRGRLRKYYETEGADHTFRIVLMDGRYELQIVQREEGIAAPSSNLEELASPDNGQAAKLTSQHLPPNPLGEPPVEDPLADKSERSSIPRIPMRGVAIALAIVVVLLAFSWLCMSIGARWRGRSARASVVPPLSAAGYATASRAETGPIRILAGYSKEKYVDRDGNVWGGDRYFTGGKAVDLEVPYIQGTADSTIYHSARIGDFNYDIPAKPGNYELRLHFVETTFGPGTFTGRGESSRVFSVLVNEQPLLTDFDVLSDAGGSYRALTRVFKDVSAASDGMIHLKFHRELDQSLVNAIELVPETGAGLNPVRIVMQENSYVDHAGRLWGSDQYAIGGVLATHQNPAVNTTDPHLFDGERFGHFTYQIPVAPGRYTVTLYFTEGYFGTKNEWPSAGGGRVFDVYANGAAVLRNFNIFEKVRGLNKPSIETFNGIEPNAAGLIVLSFIPVRNYACVSAIEVTDESR